MLVYFYIVLFSLHWTNYVKYTEAVYADTFKRCCDLGTKWAEEELNCSSFPTPVAGVVPEEQPLCLSSVEICCVRKHRESQCDAGQKAAKSGAGCSPVANKPGSENYKDCCEGCKMGLMIGSAGGPCDPKTFGPPWDVSFLACCRELVTTTESTSTATETTPSTEMSSTTQTTPATPTTPMSAVPTPPTKNKLAPPPPPPLESLCDTLPGELCAHNCVQTPGSYRCECRKGFSLMDDGKSCQQRDESDRCKINNPCEHQCFDTGVAVRCSCDRGYKLNPDKTTCTDINECETELHQCDPDQICVNEPGTYDCVDENDNSPNYEKDKCPLGYEYNSQSNVCDDIDECKLFWDDCEEGKVCENTVGSFTCVDEDPSKSRKGEENPDCPPGYYFKSSIQSCADIDECATGQDDCNRDSQICLNTQGGFTCQNRASKSNCPAGFKINMIGVCVDIDECKENVEVCSEDEECINEEGGYRCVESNKTKTETTPTTSTTTAAPTVAPEIEEPELKSSEEPKAEEVTTTPQPQNTSQPPVAAPKGSPYNPQMPQYGPYIPQLPPYAQPQPYPNYPVFYPGRQPYNPARQPYDPARQPYDPARQPYDPARQPYDPARQPYDPARQPYDPARQPYVPVNPGAPISCKVGFTYSASAQRCVDIDECVEDEHSCDSNQDCRNTIGSFKCICKTGFQLDSVTGACIDINECQMGLHDCSVSSQRCDNTIGSFQCVRFTSCGTGYTLNAASGLCEDDDECALGTHDCKVLGSQFQCRNTLGSFRCERKRCLTNNCFEHRTIYTIPTKVFLPVVSHNIPPQNNNNNKEKTPLTTVHLKQCLPGYVKNTNGYCDDINECDQNPCAKHQRCMNTQGSFQCINLIRCTPGYKINEEGKECEDIDECETGLHKCSGLQQCINREGFYICQCPPGHKTNKENQCEDINECDFYRGQLICGRNAECENTVGSYRCQCKEGFRHLDDGKMCDDIDECKENPNLCQHSCINIWGSYRCACKPGYKLNPDNRTCTDLNECEMFKDKQLCIGICENVPGSYTCRCPEGYRIGSDGRTCQDIDECAQGNICPNPDDVCWNIRGSYRCNSIKCPQNYVRDPAQRNRCKRKVEYCNSRDHECIRQPGSYSYNFITFVSNLPLPDNGQLDLFTMRGPQWDTTTSFQMEMLNVRCPQGIPKANKDYFKMKRAGNNEVILSLVRVIEGPQEAELQLTMEVYHNGEYRGSVVAKVFVIVSQYEF